MKSRGIEVVEVFQVESRGVLGVIGRGVLPEPDEVFMVNGKARIRVLGLEFHQPKESGLIAFVVERGDKLQQGDILLPTSDLIP